MQLCALAEFREPEESEAEESALGEAEEEVSPVVEDETEFER